MRNYSREYLQWWIVIKNIFRAAALFIPSPCLHVSFLCVVWCALWFVLMNCTVFFLLLILSCARVCVCAVSLGWNSECSQKLMIWKQDENKRKKRDKRKNAKANNIPKIVVTNEKASNVDIVKKARKKKYINSTKRLFFITIVFHSNCTSFFSSSYSFHFISFRFSRMRPDYPHWIVPRPNHPKLKHIAQLPPSQRTPLPPQPYQPLNRKQSFAPTPRLSNRNRKMRQINRSINSKRAVL